MVRFVVWALALLCGATAWCQISPRDFGLDTAATGEGRYWAMYRAHSEAARVGGWVDYSGIDTLYVTLPAGFKSIPLSRTNDFHGLVLFVKNDVGNGALFSMSGERRPLALDKQRVDGLDYTDVEELKEGWNLLILNDAHPWVAQRIGYGYPQYRSDVVLVHNGKGLNAPVAPYNTDSTVLKAYHCPADTMLKRFENLSFHRLPSEYKTYCLGVSCMNNVLIRNVHITTPKSRLIADGAISVSACTHVRMEGVRVDGTYSGYGRWRDYGYAFSMNNVWDASFKDVVADGNWGVFGTNNMSHTTLVNCDVNRFDIHCYGRDARLVGCTLRQRQTQFSSMYGTVEFDSCRFIDCIPVRVRSSYNAYTPFDIVMKDCVFEPTLRYHALVNIMLLDTSLNKRPELSVKCWPNVTIDNLTIVAPRVVRRCYVLDPTGTLSECEKPVDYISHVDVLVNKVVRGNGTPARVDVRLTTHPFKTIRPLKWGIGFK